jgi:hypothetical protein
MQTFRIILLFVSVATGLVGHTQDDQTIRQYIETYRELAIEEMQRTGVPASIKLAQGIHETTAGTSELVRKSNNHFGIKCKSNWGGQSVSHDDDARGECFRKYNTSQDSYKDHSDFLKGSPRYASLFTIDPVDYTQWAYGLKKAGYATNPKYPQIIIKLIEDYNLNDYTLIALGKLEYKEEVLAGISDKKKQDAAEIKPETILKDQGKQNVIPAVSITKVEVKEEVFEPAPKTPVAVAEQPATPSYPAGEFKINETRVVYAGEGTSYLSIAQQYNIPLARIFEFNDLKPAEAVDKGQLIYLQRKRKTGAHEFHIVKPGETTASIAQEEGIRLDTLLEYNSLAARSKPAAGEKLYLYGKAPAQPK